MKKIRKNNNCGLSVKYEEQDWILTRLLWNKSKKGLNKLADEDCNWKLESIQEFQCSQGVHVYKI